MLLLAHPGVAMRVGSGEAIAWLEKWRARHQPARTTSDRSNAHTKRSNTDAEKMVATKRARHESPITSDDEPEFIEDPPLVGRTTRVPVSRAVVEGLGEFWERWLWSGGCWGWRG